MRLKHRFKINNKMLNSNNNNNISNINRRQDIFNNKTICKKKQLKKISNKFKDCMGITQIRKMFWIVL